jgi:oligo-1,6-glucosidase
LPQHLLQHPLTPRDSITSTYPEGSKERQEARGLLRHKARDNGRTPVQWDDTPNAGFSPAGVKPWMRVNDDYPTVNAKAQMSQGPATASSENVSVFRFWQRALRIRKEHIDLFFYGYAEVIDNTHPSIFAFRRAGGDEVSLTILNFSAEEADFDMDTAIPIDEWVMGSYDALSTSKPKRGIIKIRPWEGLLGIGRRM